MGEMNPDPSPEMLRARLNTDQHVREERSATDESLREERAATDELLDAQDQGQRVIEVVRENRTEAERMLRDVRADSDVHLQKQADALPEMSEKLEDVAENLSNVAASLTSAAAVLQESSLDVAKNIAQITEGLRDTTDAADAPLRRPEVPQVAGPLTEQLAEIMEGIAEITSTLSEERRDADQSLREERAVTDWVIAQDLEEVESNLGQELREERHALLQDRLATDEDLLNERRHTDDAVEHVQGLLADERREHAHTARGVATRNEFLGIVSHDLRGPLMTIAAVAALMDRQATADEAGQRTHGWADRIRRSVDVMERLISDLLDFNSFEDGQLRVAAERLDIRPLIEDAIDAFRGVALTKGLSLAADLPAEPVITKHDPHRMRQVLSNLLHNAIKFTAHGSIRIRAARAGTFCEVSVSDTGVGIPHGELTEIFERFRRLNPSEHTGLGLGLYISRWIIEAHGGRIWAESQVGAGTTFHFTLPEDRQTS